MLIPVVKAVYYSKYKPLEKSIDNTFYHCKIKFVILRRHATVYIITDNQLMVAKGKVVNKRLVASDTWPRNFHFCLAWNQVNMIMIML